jgi:hypothetical protein
MAKFANLSGLFKVFCCIANITFDKFEYYTITLKGLKARGKYGKNNRCS